jgi:hypothetical protein
MIIHAGVGRNIKNTIMRIVSYILILSLLISCHINKQYDNPNILVNASLIRSYDSIGYRDTIKRKTFDVKISLINKSDKPVSFWIMTSSWFDNFLINNDYMHYVSGPINHNFPTIRHLNPNDSFVYKVSIVKQDNTMYQTIQTTKFGFIFIDSLRCQRFNNTFESIIGDKSQHDKVFWSNPLYLNEME